MTSFNNLEDDSLYDDVTPDASAMIESMRAHGYTLATAIADLIDNCIAADSKNVWLQFKWEEENSWISITDDGHGMTESFLVGAMRLGSQSPILHRDEKDLGRFGLGLKTASFSQARRLTVISQTKPGLRSLRRWDLDHLAKPEVKGWQLLREPHSSTGARATLIDEHNLKNGTQVLLEELDRVVGGNTCASEKDRENHFLSQIEQVREHISVVFHRYISKNINGIKIFLNGETVKPWDPFLTSHQSTDRLGKNSEKLGSHSGRIQVEGYILPHRDRFKDAKEHKSAGGPNGWNAQQGFYVYRGERLIIAGSWLGLGWQQEEHFKLARISLEFPNSMDHDWKIDIKKSTAEPPAILKKKLKGIAQEVRRNAKEVYAHRGKHGSRKKATRANDRLWIAVHKPGGEFSYRIDRKHVVLEPLIRNLFTSNGVGVETLLRLVEETVPIQRIWIDSAENQEGASESFSNENSDRLRKLIKTCHTAQMSFHNRDEKSAWDVLSEFDGFQGKNAQTIIGLLREAGCDE